MVFREGFKKTQTESACKVFAGTMVMVLQLPVAWGYLKLSLLEQPQSVRAVVCTFGFVLLESGGSKAGLDPIGFSSKVLQPIERTQQSCSNAASFISCSDSSRTAGWIPVCLQRSGRMVCSGRCWPQSADEADSKSLKLLSWVMKGLWGIHWGYYIWG